MQVHLTTRNLVIPDDLLERLSHKTTQALVTFGKRIHDVHLMVEDLNGPKGGVDKRCQISITAPRRPDLVVEGRGEELQALVNETLDRAVHALVRHQDRRRTIRRKVAVHR